VIVAHVDDIERIRALAKRTPALAKVVAVVPGGAQRTDSVRLGVAALPRDIEVVLVHDAARPLIRSHVIASAIEVAARDGAALVAVPVRDTLKSAPDGLHASATIEREHLWAAQTPQAFRASVLRDLLTRAASDGVSATDDAALHERYLGPVTLVRGDESNLKITTPEDLALAQALLALRAKDDCS
jgi:2-C-methyl-D-erythritol 4-phosphate cytidylyltransferase